MVSFNRFYHINYHQYLVTEQSKYDFKMFCQIKMVQVAFHEMWYIYLQIIPKGDKAFIHIHTNLLILIEICCLIRPFRMCKSPWYSVCRAFHVLQPLKHASGTDSLKHNILRVHFAGVVPTRVI
jgi:hypothetical protein